MGPSLNSWPNLTPSPTSLPPHASPAQKQHGDTKQTEDRELRVSGRNDEHNSAGLWLDGVFYDSDSSEHAEDGEGFQEGVAIGAAADALPHPSDDDGGDGDAPQHRKLKRMRGSAGGGGGGGGGSDGDGSGGDSGSSGFGVGSSAGDGKKKKKNRKGKSSGSAPRGSDGQAGALGRHQLHDRRERDNQS